MLYSKQDRNKKDDFIMKRPSELCSLSLLTELRTELEDVEGKGGDGRGSCKSAAPNPSLLRPSLAVAVETQDPPPACSCTAGSGVQLAPPTRRIVTVTVAAFWMRGL